MISYKPSYRYKSLADVPVEELALKGKVGALLDIDNTLLPYGQYDEIPAENLKWLQRAEKAGLKVILYSNATQRKIEHMKKVCGLDGVPKAYKPGWARLKFALEMLGGVSKNQVVMIGDQFCTDILGGSLCGVDTILVEPLTDKDWWGTKILRVIEWLFVPDRRPWTKK